MPPRKTRARQKPSPPLPVRTPSKYALKFHALEPQDKSIKGVRVRDAIQILTRDKLDYYIARREGKEIMYDPSVTATTLPVARQLTWFSEGRNPSPGIIVYRNPTKTTRPRLVELVFDFPDDAETNFDFLEGLTFIDANSGQKAADFPGLLRAFIEETPKSRLELYKTHKIFENFAESNGLAMRLDGEEGDVSVPTAVVRIFLEHDLDAAALEASHEVFACCNCNDGGTRTDEMDVPYYDLVNEVLSARY